MGQTASTRKVPGVVAMALMTGRPELVRAMREEIRAGLTEETADGVLDAAEELVEMRHEMLAEADRLEQLVLTTRQAVRGIESMCERLEARLRAFRSGQDPEAAEQQVVEARKSRADGGR